MSTYNVSVSKTKLYSGEKGDSTPQEATYSWSENCKNYLREYCAEGSLHGVKYLGQRRTLIEKIWWTISMIISLYLCITLVLSAYEKWENTPVIVSFASRETPNWQIPFPAVTICPENKVVPKKFNYTNYWLSKKQNISLPADIETKLGYLSLICQAQNGENFSLQNNKLPSEEIFKFFDEVQPNFYEAISDCRFMGRKENCSKIFVPIITDAGICYSFNILDRTAIYSDVVVHYKNYHKTMATNWSLDTGYPITDEAITYPRRALYSGAVFALEGKLTTYEDDYDYFCGSTSQGFRVDITHPARIPRPEQQFFKIPLDRAVEARISPEITTTSKAVKKYDPKKRNCYFTNERFLRYFNTYTQQNCQIECKLNITLQECGCVNFYMPRDNTTEVCTGNKISCIQKSSDETLVTSIENKIEKLRFGPSKKLKHDCNCKPICNSMYHSIETFSSPWMWRKTHPDVEGKHMSHFQIYFRKNQYITMDRNELFGITDFLANFGGLLGLFIGFSLLSLIEVLYYLTLRIICNIKLYGRRNWSGKIE